LPEASLRRQPESPAAVAPLRFVSAASLFDGHDAAINVMRRLLQAQGAEVVHLGHDRSVEDVVRKLNADPGMVDQFRAAYGGEPDAERFLDAIVTFERSLVTPGGRFDRWLGGDR